MLLNLITALYIGIALYERARSIHLSIALGGMAFILLAALDTLILYNKAIFILLTKKDINANRDTNKL